MGGDYNAAFRMYQDSVKYDESNMIPLFGMIYCRIRQELYDDAL